VTLVCLGTAYDDAYHIIVSRHPMAVARSLEKRNDVSIDTGLTFWTHQQQSLLFSLKNENKFTFVTFDGTQEGASKMLSQINSLLSESIKKGVLNKLTKAQEQDFFDDRLVHQKNNETIPKSFAKTQELWEIVENQKPFDEYSFDTNISTEKLGWNTLDSTQNATALINDLDEIVSQKNIILKDQERQIKEVHLQLKDMQSQAQSQLHEANSQVEQMGSQLNASRLQTQQVFSQAQANYIELLKSLYTFKKSKSYRLAQIILKPLELVRKQKKGALEHINEILMSELKLSKKIKQVSARKQLVLASLRNPLIFIKKLSFSRVKIAFKVLFQNSSSHFDIEQALASYKPLSLEEKIDLDIYEENQISFSDIHLLSDKNPEISIIIPVYNNYKTTLSCLKSIQENTDAELSYEVIIADDCSDDETVKFANNQSLRVVKTEENLGFLGNCNNAAKSVKGKYIVLLNNDTNVQKGWLTSLYKEISANDSVGVVGPRFLYPDGRLQEAGGIIFTDASGWNYGRLDNPDKPEYLYSRDVDYISGACLLFRTSDWQTIRGFDSRFTPAYYEDTDFCFSIRQLGKKVRFVPNSTVVHFEGVSHGVDESVGVKRYQKINQEKFLDKWKDDLKLSHHVDSKSLFKARIHGKNKKVILVIDHYVPMYDKDTGSRSMYMYLDLMVELGYHVIFIGDNFYPHEPYTHELQDMGVEVLYGEHYKNNWFEWLSTNQEYIDSIYLNRPHITEKYIDKILSLEKKIHLAYWGCDLHFLRLLREEELGIDNESGKSIEAWKALELSIIKKVDISFYPSQFEVDTLKQIDDSCNVVTLPLHCYESTELSQKKIISAVTQNLLFVGGFGHPPNLDGLLWFVEKIFPQILNDYPEVKLTVVGSKCSEEVYKLANENIVVLGEISDEKLVSAYNDSAISIIPLRYGAGVKGKVLESISFGKPVVTTAIGAEGLPEDPQEYLCVHDQEKEFADAIKLLFEDEKLYFNKAQQSYHILEEYFSKQAVAKVIRSYF